MDLLRALVREQILSLEEGTGGFNKPAFRGSVFGQTVAGEERLPTGKRRPITDPDTGEERWIPVKAKQTVCYWTWDGNDWLTEEEFAEKYPRREGFKKPPGMKLR